MIDRRTLLKAFGLTALLPWANLTNSQPVPKDTTDGVWRLYPGFMRQIIEGRADFSRLHELHFKISPWEYSPDTITRAAEWNPDTLSLSIDPRPMQWTANDYEHPRAITGYWGRLPFISMDYLISLKAGDSLKITTNNPILRFTT